MRQTRVQRCVCSLSTTLPYLSPTLCTLEEDGGARDSKFGRGVATVDVFGVSVPIADCQNPSGAGQSALDSDRARLRERALDLLQDSTLAKVAIAEAAARKDGVIAEALALVEDYVSFIARGDKVTTDAD